MYQMAENGIQDDFAECPLCMEPLALDDINFYPCACRYQICRFCWHRIRTDENGLCPHCREPYSENPAEYTPPTQEQMAKLKSDKKQKTVEKRQKIIDSRKSLASVRVVQKNLVFVIGLSPRLADPEVLKKTEYFGKFGRIYKVVINNHTVYNGAQGPSVSAYVTYVRNEDASKAITAVNNAFIDGRYLKASFGTTKYCTSFLRGMPCSKPDCMYLHELGDNSASFTKEDMQLGKHQVYETATLTASNVPVSFKETQPHAPPLQQQHSVGGTGGGVKIKHVAHKPTATENAESALPATASWGSSVKSVSPATNHTTDSAQHSLTKDTKTNSHAAVSHSHSVGTSIHKHQQLSKSHSHGTGTGHSTSSHSRSSKVSSKDLSTHHSRTKSGALSPAHSNEATSKKHSIRENEHIRSNSTGKSTPSLSPKSTLSGSSSTGSLKHDMESESETKPVSGGVASGEVSLDTSKEEEEGGGVAEEEEVEEVISGNERGEGAAKGEWCQIDASSEESQPLPQVLPVKTQEGTKEPLVVDDLSEVVTAVVLEEKEEKEGVATVDKPESTPVVVSQAPPPQAQAPPTSSDQDTNDNSIVQVIPTLGSGVGQLGSLGVSWNTPLPQQIPTSTESIPQAPPTEDVATSTSSTDHEDDLGFDPWNVSQQGLADLMKSERNQQHHYSFPNQKAPPTNTTGHATGPLSNGIGCGYSGNKPNMLQEEFKALFPNVNVSFEGASLRSVGGSSDTLLTSGLSLSVKPGPTPTTTSSYIPSRLDSALSSTYHSLLGTSPLPPMSSSSSSVAPGGPLKMFLGQHQPGFPSSSIKVHPRAPGSGNTVTSGGSQSIGSKLGASDWPDLGVSVTSKPTQWTGLTSTTTETSNKDPPTVATTTTSTLPPPPPGFSAKTTPTPGSTHFSGTAVSSSGSVRAPGSALNSTVNHTLWTGGVANFKGNIAGHPLLQSWANFMKFSSLTPVQQQQLTRGSQIYQQLLIQQQYLIRQGLLIQSSPYYQTQAAALAQAQATLRAQLQQNILRQQQIAAAMAAASQKIVNSATSTASSNTTNLTSSSSGALPGGSGNQQGTSQQPRKTFTSSESGAKSSTHGVGEGSPTVHPSISTVGHQRPHNPQMISSAKHRTVSNKLSKNNGSSATALHHSSNTTHTASAGNTERKSVRVKAK